MEGVFSWKKHTMANLLDQRSNDIGGGRVDNGDEEGYRGQKFVDGEDKFEGFAIWEQYCLLVFRFGKKKKGSLARWTVCFGETCDEIFKVEERAQAPTHPGSVRPAFAPRN
ncbi:hypothetical protein NL676_016465 [Syzygium grande]|nr:hypothetical protein NL676_016465 [Syzygium grande]